MNTPAHVDTLTALLSQKQHLYRLSSRAFYGAFAICGLFFAGGIIWSNVMAIAGGFVTGMMLGMAYLGVVMTLDDEIRDIRTKIAAHSQATAPTVRPQPEHTP